MTAHARFRACELAKAVGVDGADGRRRSDGRAGHLCHGPYITLGPGEYSAGFFVRREPGEAEGEIRIDVCADQARTVFARRTAPVREVFASIDGLVSLDFAIAEVARGFELRLHVPPRSRLEVTEAVLFRRDLPSRGFR